MYITDSRNEAIKANMHEQIGSYPYYFKAQSPGRNRVYKILPNKRNPYPPLGRSLEIPRGREVLTVKILEAKYEAKLKFPGERGCKTNNLPRESMDIFWNCTIPQANLQNLCKDSRLEFSPRYTYRHDKPFPLT